MLAISAQHGALIGSVFYQPANVRDSGSTLATTGNARPQHRNLKPLLGGVLASQASLSPESQRSLKLSGGNCQSLGDLRRTHQVCLERRCKCGRLWIEADLASGGEQVTVPPGEDASTDSVKPSCDA